VRCVLDEVFGAANYVSTVTVQKTGSTETNLVPKTVDYIHLYAKDRDCCKYRQLYLGRTAGSTTLDRYDWVSLPGGVERRVAPDEAAGGEVPAGGRRLQHTALVSARPASGSDVREFQYEGRAFSPGQGTFKSDLLGLSRLGRAGRLRRAGQTIRYARYVDDFAVVPLHDRWESVQLGTALTYVVQTGPKVIERCMLMSTDPGDLVLDPTCVRAGTRVLVAGGEGSPSPTLPANGEGEDRNGKGAGSSPPPFAGEDGWGAAPCLNSRPIESLQPGDLVLAHDGEPHRVLRVLRRRYCGEMIGLRTDEGPVLWLTADHRVLARTRPRTLGGQRDWSAAPREHLDRRRELRREATLGESRLWRRLRRNGLGFSFRRQHPIGPFIADFYSREAHLVVEVDGDSHYTAEGQAHDIDRDRYLRGLGLDVLHVTNEDVRTNSDGVCLAIRAHCERRAGVADATWVQAGHLAPGDFVFAGPSLRPMELREVRTERADETVYDIEVEGAHSFVTETCAVHNCGSGTTAFVAEQWGRRWITCDTSRVAVALARTRLMAAKYPFYLLADSMEGLQKQAEVEGRVPEAIPDRFAHDVRRGFVYKRVPHVTLKSIANNEEIDEIHARWQEQLEPLRERLNQAAGQAWEEWEVPRPDDAMKAGNCAPSPTLPANGEGEEREGPGTSPLPLRASPANGGGEPPSPSPFVGRAGEGAVPGLSAEALDLLEQWWDLRRKRQQEIDDSIARRAEFELLYDQPYEDSKRIRVSGPFTVESLSPHRMLEASEDLPASVAEGKRDDTAGQFEALVLDNLRAAGVQNTVRNERLRFDALEPHAGRWIHATGDYTDAGGAVRRVAVSIGPEHGTVGPQLVKEAVKEAVQGIGYDVLVVCGFAFDPHVSEEAKRYGNLTVLPTRMNPDLAMGDLLKKTGAGNLFMVFGEPDLEVAEQGGKLVVQLRGVDVYDPTTGEVRSNTTDDIACWFIDTNYNGESFFVRHAYFTGADEPYDKLKRALRAEIDEAVWSALYSTKSLPFDRPESGKIAVKVINHYGDEVLKVYDV